MITFKHQAGFIALSRPAGLIDSLTGFFTGANKPSRLVLHNDDLNSGYWVRDQLVKVCGLSSEDATRIMFEAHQTSSSIIFEGSRKECFVMAQKLREIGPDSRFFDNALPINVTVKSV